MTKRTHIAALAILVVSALGSAACASKTINQVLADPSRYRNRQVELSGSVVDSYSLANRGAYRIRGRHGPALGGVRQRRASQGRAGHRHGDDS